MIGDIVISVTMVDSVSKKVRSRIMSRIRGKDTSPEIILRRELFKRGYRYSLSHRFNELNFRPDIVMVSRRVCIFVDGCFWHGCPRCYRPPKSNKRYWVPKIRRNMERDKEQDRYLMKHGWKVIRVWEHGINSNLGKLLKDITRRIGD